MKPQKQKILLGAATLWRGIFKTLFIELRIYLGVTSRANLTGANLITQSYHNLIRINRGLLLQNYNFIGALK
jgi:hypothetical protein